MKIKKVRDKIPKPFFLLKIHDKFLIIYDFFFPRSLAEGRNDFLFPHSLVEGHNDFFLSHLKAESLTIFELQNNFLTSILYIFILQPSIHGIC